MVPILYKPTQNAIWLLYYINKMRYGCYYYVNKHKTCDMVAIIYKQTQNTIWLLY